MFEFEFLNKTHTLENKIVINYNTWFVDKKYKKALFQ